MNPPPIPAPPQPELQQGAPAVSLHKKRRRGRLFVALALVLIAGLFLLLKKGGTGAVESSRAIVAVTKVDREDLTQDLWLSAEFHPFQEVSLHAKVAGYLKSISVDVGDQVKSGQKIAELEIPELEDDLARAQSAYQASLEDVKRAEADFAQADVIYQRLLRVSKEHPKLVAQQELDDAKAKADAMKGALGAAQQRVDERQSEVNKTKTLRDYASIIVPFDGIITRRYVDQGALIQAGTASGAQSMPLVDLAQQNLLRLVFPVPESAAPIIHDGAPVEITVSAVNEKFRSTITRFSGKVDRSTRTMHTEVDVPNPDNRYKPGMYAFVRLILQEQKDALAVPVQALVAGEKPSVFILNKGGVIEQRAVVVGMQTPDKVEVREGLAEGDLVIVGNRNGVHAGQKAAGKLSETPKVN
jgi:RND family efflux transporter MFP subunit